MSGRRLKALEPTERRRALARAVVRSLLTVAAVVWLYYAAPFDGRPGDVGALLYFVCGAVAFAGVLAWQLRCILRSDLPQVRAAEGLAIALPVFLTLFAGAYVSLSTVSPGSFTEPMGRTSALYFAIVTLGTVGYGDIAAQTDPARILVAGQILADLLFVSVVLKVFFFAAQRGLDEEAGGSASGPAPGTGGGPVPPGRPAD
ncbi:potassium channel family protein [Streptomyces sp. NPDC097619]|uniref:potassium channel family protein n=1 Tax=Streptomyces sp. NPDC097619 TaxID=3157228 RepID=UPI00332AEF9B